MRHWSRAEFKKRRTARDLLCRKWAEPIWYAEYDIRHRSKGINFSHVLWCIQEIEENLDYLKFYIGFVKAKRTILDTFRDYSKNMFGVKTN